MQPSRVSFCTYYSLKCLFIIFIIHYKDPKTKTGSFSFKKLSDFPPFLTIRCGYKPHLPGLAPQNSPKERKTK